MTVTFLVIGLGSMGKRRVRDLLQLQKEEVVGWDPREDRRKESESRFGIRTFPLLEKALEENPRAIVISTPPDTHMHYAHLAADLGIPFFTEASVTSDGVKELIGKLEKAPDLVAAPSCTMLFHPAVGIVRQLAEQRTAGDKTFFLYHSGQYLADWHPYEDYRSFYVVKRETGGCREIVPFEWVWLTAVFGPIDRWSAAVGKVTELDADIDDVYQMLLHFAGGTQGQMTVDVVSRSPVRSFRLIGEKGSVLWDFFAPEVQVFHGQNKETVAVPVLCDGRPFQYEDMYRQEMKAFLQAVAGQCPFPHDYRKDLVLLETLEKVEASSARL